MAKVTGNEHFVPRSSSTQSQTALSRVESSPMEGSKDDEDNMLIIKHVRVLITELCQQFDGGHPGGAIGMVPLGICLWKYAMRYSPANPDWFNRDRFILSNGHTCLLQYIFMHLTGYEEMTFDQLKSYHSSNIDTRCPGHPEIQHSGIEVTTGPLGQGIANAVGMAVAAKHLGSLYNKPDFEIVNPTIWCIVGDGCLQEGVAMEAISLAGHWKLDNLIVIYDNNRITSDGSLSLASSEDIVAKVEACGWRVFSVEHGSSNILGILEAIQLAKNNEDKPSFINVHTIIGTDTEVAGNRKAHGTSLGEEGIRKLKELYGINQDTHFHIPHQVRQLFKDQRPRGINYVEEWTRMLTSYGERYPGTYKELLARIAGDLPLPWAEQIPKAPPFSPMSTVQCSGIVIHTVIERVKSFMVGTADLDSSVNLAWPQKTEFQHPLNTVDSMYSGDYRGRYIHWGIREYAMMAVSNGLAAFNPGTIIPITSTFLMFTLYGAAAIRMGALQGLQVIHVATHDSIGVGADGPTHQPIEVAALYRAMPNILYIRPADFNETAGAWKVAIKERKTPSVISLSSQELAQYPNFTRQDGVAKGAYVLGEDEGAQVTMIGVGSELTFAVQTTSALQQMGIRTRLISFPCQRLFEMQTLAYKHDVLRRDRHIPAIVIEAYSALGWERYADAGIFMRSFGKSLPANDIFQYFGFEEMIITRKVGAFLKRWANGEVARGDFELL